MSDDATLRNADDAAVEFRAIVDVLDRAVDTIEALDVLLFLVEAPTRWYALHEIARGAALDVDRARDALRELRPRGLITDVTGSLFRLASETSIPRPTLRELARVTARHRMTVVEHVSRRAVDRYRVLAEAFTRGGRR
jgi:hypothetical protein